jgi:branched-chain amino acid transport system permease protein
VQQLSNTFFTGLTLGVIYAAFALALVLIYRSTRIVNFAQAPMAMLTTYIALTLIDAGLPYWVGFLAALASGFMLGVAIEFTLIRPVMGGSELNTVILTLGVFVALHSIAALIFGSSYHTFPAPFGVRGIEFGDITIALTGFGIFTILSVLVVLLALVFLFRRTNLGLTMRASAFNPETASLLGVPVGWMLTLGWGLAATVGALSGLLVAGGSLMHPAYMDSVIVYGFVAAVLGGIDSPVGAVVGGLFLGVALSLVSGYVGSELVGLASLASLLAVLLIKPSGLFSTTRARVV